MPLLWLKVALALYGVGLVYALAALVRRAALPRLTMPVVGLGVVFHFVSLVEAAIQAGGITPASIHHSESLLGFLIITFFMAVYTRYRVTAPALFVFPVVFLLCFAAAIGQAPPQIDSPVLRSGWIFVHIALIFAGYAALFFAFIASVLYLLQENNLKAKKSVGASRLPSLQVIDEIGYRSLLLGFPFMTLGLLAGSVIAQVEYGPAFFLDPKILLALLMWSVYIVLLYTRWNNGWRGRKAAMLSAAAFVAALATWAANYVSEVHKFVVQ
jgi:ABC-type uncharacterized transport system permease subunit